MYHDTPEKIAGYYELVGKKVCKTSLSNNKATPKPFKSGRRVNTVKAVIFKPEITAHALFIFEEDDSFVRCYQCRLAPPEYLAQGENDGTVG